MKHASVKRQGGFFTLDLGLALIISAAVAFLTFQATQKASEATAASLQADALYAVRTAAHKLLMMNYSKYQAGADITRDGPTGETVTLADGDLAGQSRHPTFANLNAMDLGINGVSDTGIYKTLTNATYDVTITRLPAGCEAVGAGASCQVSGMVCLNKPVKGFKDAEGEVDNLGMAVMLGKLGGVGGASFLGTNNTITSADGSWSQANPYAGSQAGIVCARFGWGTEGDDYLRLNETRDPQFQNDVTVKGHVVMDAPVGVSGDACSPENSMVWGAVATVPTLFKCTGGIWVPTGVSLAVDGSACAPEGKVAQSATGAYLVCRDASYRPMSDMVGRGGIYSVGTYANGSVVPTPLCTGVNTNAHLVAMGVVSACSYGGGTCSNDSGSFAGSVGSGGLVSILGSDGVTVAGADSLLVVASMCTTW